MKKRLAPTDVWFQARGVSWELEVGTARSIAVRRALGVAALIVGSALALVVGIALGLSVSARLGFSSGMLAFLGTLWLGMRAFMAPPKMSWMGVSVPAPGTLRIGDGEVTVRSCFYDGVDRVLWMRGLLGIPRACVRASREDALAVVGALQRNEHGLRTLRASSALAALPFVGFFLVMMIGCAASFGVVMLLAGPPHIGIPAAAITIPLAIFAFRPARIRVDDETFEWRWWWWRRRIPLVTIRSVEGKWDGIRVETDDDRSRMFRTRIASNGAWWARPHEEKEMHRIASFASFVEVLRDAALFR